MISTLIYNFWALGAGGIEQTDDPKSACAQDTTARSRREMDWIQSFGHVCARFVLDSV
jgi:hypothetical protein